MASTGNKIQILQRALYADQSDQAIRIRLNREQLKAGHIGAFKDQPLHLDQLEALHLLATMYGSTPELIVKFITIEELYITKLGLQNPTKNRPKLKLPLALIKLQTFNCAYNKLNTLTTPQNTPLKRLYCDGNQLTTLTIPPNTPLDRIHCPYNQLKTLTIPPNTPLTELYCWHNQLTTLTIPPNTPLIELHCQNNKLTTLTIPKHNFELLADAGVQIIRH